MKFQDYFEQELTEKLQTADNFQSAIKSLQEVMPKLKSAQDRSRAYYWLGNIYMSKATNALSQGETEKATSAFSYVEEFYVKSLEEDQGASWSRVSLARYYLTFGQSPRTAMELLEKTEEEAEPVYRHQGMALKGVAYAFMDQGDKSIQCLDQAYSLDFKGVLEPQQIDLSSLMYMNVSGIKFTKESAGAIVDRLVELGVPEDQRLRQLRTQLGG